MRKVFHKKKTLDLTMSEGKVVVAPSFFHKGHLSTVQEGLKYTTAGQTINMFDELVTQPKRLYGGRLWISPDSVADVDKRDYIEVSVVDKDDVLGAFSLYGLDKAQGHVLELSKFVIKEYIRKGSAEDGYPADFVSSVKGVSELPAGIYVRITYTSYGSQPIDVYAKTYSYL